MEEESLGIRRAQRGKSADRPGERPVRSMRARSDRPGGGVDVEHMSQLGECGCLQPRVGIQEEHKLRASGSPAAVAPVRKASVPRRVDHCTPARSSTTSKLRSGHALSTTRMDTPGMPTKGSTEARRHWRLLYATTTTSTESVDMSCRSQAIAGGASSHRLPRFQLPDPPNHGWTVPRRTGFCLQSAILRARCVQTFEDSHAPAGHALPVVVVAHPRVNRAPSHSQPENALVLDDRGVQSPGSATSYAPERKAAERTGISLRPRRRRRRRNSSRDG